MPSDQFRVATLNLFNYIEPPNAFYDPYSIYSKTQWQQKQTWTLSTLEQLAPDIMGFQEVFSLNTLEALTKQCQAKPLKYFAAVDSPVIEHGFVQHSPVVALASRYPIGNVGTITINRERRQRIGLDDSFSFSRAPLRAIIQTPQLGAIRVYVVHLKSPRPITFNTHPTGPAGNEHDSLAEPIGRWAAYRQRGNEAAAIMTDMTEQYATSPLPTLIMGDFNDTLDSPCLTPFTHKTERSTFQAPSTTQPFRLSDAWSLLHDQPSTPATHYWGAAGRTLDHILLSHEFDTNARHNFAHVEAVSAFDHHLRRPDNSVDQQCSDHAAVSVDITTRQS